MYKVVSVEDFEKEINKRSEGIVNKDAKITDNDEMGYDEVFYQMYMHTICITHQLDGGNVQQSSGTLVKKDSRYFIITAKHVVDDFLVEIDQELVSSTSPNSFLELDVHIPYFGEYNYTQSIKWIKKAIRHTKTDPVVKRFIYLDSDEDIAIIEIFDSVAKNVEDSGAKVFLDINNLKRDKIDFNSGHYMFYISGYPLHLRDWDLHMPKFLYVYTSLLSSYSEMPAYLRSILTNSKENQIVLWMVDRNFNAELMEEMVLEQHNLNGMSGGGVFCFELFKDEEKVQKMKQNGLRVKGFLYDSDNDTLTEEEVSYDDSDLFFYRSKCPIYAGVHGGHSEQAVDGIGNNTKHYVSIEYDVHKALDLIFNMT